MKTKSSIVKSCNESSHAGICRQRKARGVVGCRECSGLRNERPMLKSGVKGAPTRGRRKS